MEGNDQPPPSPYPPSASLLKDISNFKTPKRASRVPNFTSSSPYPQFFTASKQTPKLSSSVRSSRPKHKTATARRLKAFELEQSQSSRKVQTKKEQSLKSLSKSLTTWLNFLLQNPRSCGCDLTVIDDQDGSFPEKLGGKRQRNAQWRSPKRLRGGDFVEINGTDGFSSSKNYELLRKSLKDVCSLDDLKHRMRLHLSLATCKEIFDIMSHVVKNIDEGRLKMKSHCPIVTDVGMKEKAIQILMCYNPIWIRIGLHIIFGGDSLLPSGDVKSDKEIAFLKMVIEKQFFSHAGLAKAYAYNKMVEGLYRPGYYEYLGNIILKRFLLLVLILDRAKSSSALSLKYGIDGVDGGSPLLFVVQSSIKSSRQMINDFLSSEIMLGEGNLLAHLVIVGYRVSYQQCPLFEYDFRVTDLFEDLQDGLRLCRAIQLLRSDSSILMKMVVPSDTRKKNLVNCGIALQYLKHAGVRLCDDDGMMIMEDDIANGDKELTISLLWSMFIQLQLPLLINSKILVEEILKIHGTNVDTSKNINLSSASLQLLLNWIQVVCDKYDYKVDNISSLVDGKAVWCLLDYYFRKELCCSRSLKDPTDTRGEESIMSASEYTDAVHNFILSQKLITLLGNFPEILQISDILEHSGAISERSVVILLVFLASQLTAKKSMDQLNFHKLLCCNCQSPERRHSISEQCGLSLNAMLDQEEIDEHCNEDAARRFNAIKAWWQDMAERNNSFVIKPAISTLQHCSTKKSSINFQKDNAATLIQSHFRRSIARYHFLKMKNAVLILQTVIRAWFMVKRISAPYRFCDDMIQDSIYERWKQSERDWRYVNFIFDRHSFVKVRKSVVFIQQAARIWMMQRIQAASIRNHDMSTMELMMNAPHMCQMHRSNLEREAAIRIQLSWKNYIDGRCLRNQHLAAIKIQHHFQCWQLRKKFLKQKEFITKVQRCCRGWLIRRNFMHQIEAVKKIQNVIRGLNCQKAFNCRKNAAIEIQRFVRGQIARKRLLGASHFNICTTVYCKFQTSGCFPRPELKVILSAILKLQRWWRCVLLHKLRTRSAIVIQSYFRGWVSRQKVYTERRYAVMIQSHWKGYLVRKESRGQLLDLRLRVQKSAKNIDDSMRIINRLKVALSELLSMKSISGILHTCATLDMTTQHSQKCCEELVAAGAIGILLKLIRLVSRSIPDQEILKHALSTIRNLTRYQHLTEVLIDSHGSIEIIFWEFLRNKEDGYFIASEILKKICSNKKGGQSLRKLPALIKRLHSLVEELTRKSTIEKRNPQGVAAREKTEKRLREAVGILKLMTIK
ncbi:abnormal spindle-like microcephaly-associated protein isoform X2 [Ricinus communis]|uniref:abnormal spindle-like microcephaly-associated protein isoform X2 n=1 Tax=Ricinus communis TaxID=3988 RepID=UPI000772AABC|nr:abnormal spindle-like microcephaly-associated protein isoform X2 [Ricinus communis]|eukprot:XP_015574312.1 abnormal spindle-like microcephaly-associated protein isoform X2 [Ricinus communis]